MVFVNKIRFSVVILVNICLGVFVIKVIDVIVIMIFLVL